MVFIVIRVKVIYFGIFCIVKVFIGGPLEKRFLPKGNPPKINQIKSNQIILSKQVSVECSRKNPDWSDVKRLFSFM